MGLLDNTVVGDIWDKWRKGALEPYNKFNAWKNEKTNENRKEYERKFGIYPNPNKKKYAEIQKELEQNVNQVHVGPGKSITLDVNKKTGEVMGEPHMSGGYSYTDNTMTGEKSTEKKYMEGNLLHKDYKKIKITDNDGESIAKASGMDWNAVKKHWKDKGGMDALMANPAFTLGLALMQSSAKGKRINEDILDNFVKATNISAEYKDRVKAKGGIYEATADQIASIKATLATMKTTKPGFFERWKPGNQPAMYEAAVEKIAIEMQKRLEKMREKDPGKKIDFNDDFRRKVIEDLIRKKQIKVVGGNLWFDSTLEAGDFSKLKPLAEGGPVQAGRPYVVGEEGPEIIIPHSSGNVLSNDDSQIYAMLLAANPQLQKVSKARAERILRSRFPEYFE